VKTESELEPEYVAEADTGDNLINLVSQPDRNATVRIGEGDADADNDDWIGAI
jgi:hypothetical protein